MQMKNKISWTATTAQRHRPTSDIQNWNIFMINLWICIVVTSAIDFCFILGNVELESHLSVFKLIALSLLCARQKLYAALSVKNSLDDTILRHKAVISQHNLQSRTNDSMKRSMDCSSKGICSGQTLSRWRCIFMDYSLSAPLPAIFLFGNHSDPILIHRIDE